MSQSGYTSELTQARTLVLDADPRYDIIDNQAVIGIKNTPQMSKVLAIPAANSSIDSYQFSHQFDRKNFVNTGVTLRIELPLKFTYNPEADAQPVGVTKDNFVTQFFNDFSHLTLRTGGLLNLIEKYSVTLNSTTFNVNDLQRLCPAIFRYYENDDINAWFEASQVDRYQNYEAYQGDERYKQYQVTAANGTNETVAVPIKIGANEENIFSGGYKDGYNTRTPLMTFVSYDALTKICRVKMTLEAFLPFSMLGLPGSDLSLYGVQNFQVSVDLVKNQTAAHLFSLAQRQTGTAPDIVRKHDFSAIELDTSQAPDTTRSRLLVPYYNAPEYITEDMIDPSTGNVKPYAFAFNKIAIQQPIEVSLLPGETKTFNLPTHTVSTVPRAMYIYALRKKDFGGGSVSVANTPTVFARIDNLQVRFADLDTIFPNDASALYNIAKSNDLHMDRMSSLYTAGFPLKLEVQKDLTTGGSIYCGLARSTPTAVSGAIRDLRSDKDVGKVTYEVLVAYAYDVYCDHFNGSFDIKDSLLIDTSAFGDRKYHTDFYRGRMRRVTQIGGFWGTVWRGLKSGLRAASNFFKNNPNVLNSIGSAIDPSLSTIGNTASSLLPGSGLASNQIGGQVRTLGAGSVETTKFRNKTSTPFKGGGKF